ncbi:hypothetical protein [Acaryochloris sp. CCMEE 5410]|uniref:hypothetical protein n=1 Tax=Acaryochloris sp. CCMEE 5410 TaxID=310037 RepID=UPI000301CD6C|nr:hypothetical protein [Acaryochloris sp. CCMEE 5410]KAI9133782.1 hypothetical protein ON05_011085 [Acaryochloris sp. CCMEE 5410]
MELHDQADEPPERSSDVLSKIAGTAIACLTLAMPLYVTTYYSSTRQIPLAPQFSESVMAKERPQS